ncbi:MAG: hypothetical protein IXK25_00050 [Candidatus Kinetoplastibacterium crithidii]|nr:hypothetical protein [Candidatus Kinetoplastibacterium crithidii]
MTFNVNKINNNYSQKEVLNAKGQRFIVQPPQPLINGTLGNPDLSINNTKQINTISLVETDIENTNNSNNSNEAVAKRLIINPNNITEIPLLDLTKQ